MLSIHQLELLSPARDAETGIAAIDHGADAVYIGGPGFGARQSAGNGLDDIARLCDYAHRFDARVYLTLNTLLRNDEIEPARALAFEAAAAGVDVLILQDMGLLEGPLPNVELHASTQCDIRTPEKAAFLEAVGFSQMVLARELSLTEVRAVRDALTHARIEYFVHGALCVSYSGQCYISEAMVGRSANRGACAQMCRLPYDVDTLEGKRLRSRSHVLSLKDNEQLENLERLIDAGVSAFKIEGRLKDVDYVKNITAAYRLALDGIIARRPELSRASAGETRFFFEPDTGKTFQRGKTDYFVDGRRFDAPYAKAQLESPKNTGEPVARVVRIREDRILVAPMKGVTLVNGDGLTYVAHDEVSGFHVNRAEHAGEVVALFPRERVDKLYGLTEGAVLSRNRDRAFEKKLAGKTSERKIDVDFVLTRVEDSIELVVCDGTHSGFAAVAADFDEARDTEKNVAALKANLAKLGDTIYRAREIFVPENFDAFLPPSMVNALRRHAVEELDGERARARVKTRRAPVDETARFPQAVLDYRANVANDLARRFYERHGAKVRAPAFEIKPAMHADLMSCRHCIRAELGLCPKTVKYFPAILQNTPKELLRPDPLVLTNSAGERFHAVFHCKADPCYMTIVSPAGLPKKREKAPDVDPRKDSRKDSRKDRDEARSPKREGRRDMPRSHAAKRGEAHGARRGAASRSFTAKPFKKGAKAR